MYDYGLYDNEIAMLCKDWVLWLLPTTPNLIEDGCKYKINQKNKDYVSFELKTQLVPAQPYLFIILDIVSNSFS